MANAPSAESDLANDTTTFDNADSSTDNDTQDTDVANDNDLADDSTNFDDFDDDETDESDTTEEDSAATDEDDEEDSEDLGDDDDTEDSESKSQKKGTQDNAAAEAERKRQNDLAAQRRIQETNAKRDQAKRAAGVDYVSTGAQDAFDRVINSGGSQEEAQAAANQETAVRQLQVDAYSNRVQTNMNTLTSQAAQAKAAVPELVNGSPAQKAFLNRAVDEFEAMYVSLDRNGDPVEVRADLTKYLQAKRAEMLALSGDGATRQVKDKKNQKTRTLNPGQRPPQKKKTDSQLDAFDEEAAKP